MSTLWSPEPVNMFSYLAEGTLQLWLKAGVMNLGDNMYYMAEPNIIMWILKNRELFQFVLRKICNDRRIKKIGIRKGLPPSASRGFENRGKGPRTGVDFKSWTVLQPIASKDMQTLWELNLYNNLNEQLSGFSTGTSAEDATTNILTLSIETDVELLTYTNLRL